jgi:hypothetical protein
MLNSMRVLYLSPRDDPGTALTGVLALRVGSCLARPDKMLTTKHAFYFMWVFIVFVSVHDGCLVLVNRPAMWSVEQNPLGRWLIHVWGNDIWLLVMLKAIGTVCVASILLLLYSLRPRLAWIICAALGAIQLGLLVYLYAA